MSTPPADAGRPAADEPGRGRRPMSTRRKALVGVLVTVSVLALGAVLLAGAFIWSFSGGWDGLRPEADPTGRPVTTARAAATTQLPARQDELDALVAPVMGEPLARGTVDACRRGQNNWKIHDGYTLRCRTSVVAVYPWPGTQDSLDRLTAALAAHGYTATYPESVLTSPGPGGNASGQYRSGGTDLVVRIDQPGIEPLIRAYFPEGDAYLDDRTDALASAAAGSGQPTLTVLATRTYFED